MAGTFERFVGQFDDFGRRVLTYAEQEAVCLNHGWIGTEHLLLGLLRDSEGVAGRLLLSLGIGLDETRAAVDYVISSVPANVAPRGAMSASDIIGLAPRAKLALELAVADARSHTAGLAGPEHLLLGLLHGEDDGSPGRGVAAGILGGFGVTADQVRAALPRFLADTEPRQAQPHQYQQVRAGTWEEATTSVAQWRERRRQGRRYSLVLPDDLFEEVERLAERQNTSVIELLRRFTRLGLLAMQLQERPDAALIIREGTTERVLMLL